MSEQVSRSRRCSPLFARTIHHDATIDQRYSRHENGPHLPNPLRTPRQRVLELSELSDNVEARVDAATASLTGSRCLIENSERSCPADYVHVMDRSTPSSVVIPLTSLEMCWNIPPGTLNVDSCQNIFRLTPKYHKLFKEEGWLLLPEQHIMRQYLDATERPPSDFPVIDDAPYKYTVLVHEKMKPISIRRQMDASDGSGAPTYTDITYPFQELGTIVSHIHPRFVIVSSGFKWEHQSIFYNNDTVTVAKCWIVKMIIQIHNNWTTRWQLPEERYSTYYDDSGSDVAASDSAHTPPVRLRRPPRGSTKRRADSPAHGSSRPAHRRKSRSNSNSVQLDQRSLRASILDWATGVEYSSKFEDVGTPNRSPDFVGAAMV